MSDFRAALLTRREEGRCAGRRLLPGRRQGRDGRRIFFYQVVGNPARGEEQPMTPLAEPNCRSPTHELALRRKCSPAWIKSGKLDAGDAEYQIAVQEEIIRTLIRLGAEQRQMSLFGDRT